MTRKLAQGQAIKRHSLAASKIANDLDNVIEETRNLSPFDPGNEDCSRYKEIKVHNSTQLPKGHEPHKV